MTPKRLIAGLCAGAVLALMTFGIASADDYPSRPITILVPLATSSIADMQAFVKAAIPRWGKIVQAAGIAGVE